MPETRAEHAKRQREYNRRHPGRAAERMREYRLKHHDRDLLSRQRSQQTRVIAAARLAPCLDCGQSYPPYVMEFDHREPALKYRDVTSMYRAPLPALLAEIAKCDVVCANCHRARGYFRRQARQP